ncbi:uncharacterized protein LOC124274916 [Haliotis rubra]|uniref:uncharacterized protein LOC124274916 n=1 Tax=Haliotis rubra TaxID=36100 RepID=UPI001EE58966|nr:uncharacterized protein LOC124274916 [Haliotis rubra]
METEQQNKLPFLDIAVDNSNNQLTTQQLRKIGECSLTVGDQSICPVPQVKNLGVVFRSSMSPESQALTAARSATFHLRRIGKIRRYLDIDTTKLLVQSYVISRLDYCNSLVSGAAAIQHLQFVQNRAARIITRTKCQEHITPVLRSLHWLPVKRRIQYKIICITYSTLYDINSPAYLKDIIEIYRPTRVLRSEKRGSLKMPATKTSMGDRAFSAAAPALWNSLPVELRSVSSLEAFRSQLKTHLFLATY